MARKTRESRLQYGLFATPLEEMIADDNPVRVIDAFVDAMGLASFGFKAVTASQFGAPSYDPSDLLKIYFYGYFNRIRSSRCLERECARNVEMMWLTGRPQLA
ncbi:MAG: transposase [Saprospiraceae bacterium]|nr:transposase [Saprospiraceae bacterium]